MYIKPQRNYLIGLILIGISFGIVILYHHNQVEKEESYQTEIAIRYDMIQIMRMTYSTDALHQAIQHTVCILLQMKMPSESITHIIQKTVDNSMQFHRYINASMYCPMSVIQ